MSLFSWMEQNLDIKYFKTTECFLDLFFILRFFRGIAKRLPICKKMGSPLANMSLEVIQYTRPTASEGT
jgi:hypothetical protein